MVRQSCLVPSPGTMITEVAAQIPRTSGNSLLFLQHKMPFTVRSEITPIKAILKFSFKKLTSHPICKQVPATSDSDSKATCVTAELESRSKGESTRPLMALGWQRQVKTYRLASSAQQPCPS